MHSAPSIAPHPGGPVPARPAHAVRAAALAAALLGPAGAPGQVAVTQRNVVPIAAATTTDQNGAAFTITGLSGVTHLGGGDFVAVMDNSDKLVRLHVDFAADGSITAVQVLGGVTLSESSDFEGVAFTDRARNTVLVATETGPAIKEASLATGQILRTVAPPPVFANLRPNFGFESLALRGNTGEVWTCNEEALTVDGPLSSQAAGTTVRLLRLAAPGLAPQAQCAYVTSPWHGSSITGARSGVSDLVALPSGALLALERSFAFSLTGLFRSQIVRVGVAGATDVSGNTAGLAGAAFTPASRTPLWSGQLNQNLEGLCLGPRLPGGGWALLGIVDDADPLSTNVVVSFAVTDAADCLANYDGVGSADLLDIFAFLDGWFRGDPLADVDGRSGVDLLDIFVFLGAWFATGC